MSMVWYGEGTWHVVSKLLAWPTDVTLTGDRSLGDELERQHGEVTLDSEGSAGSVGHVT